MDRLNVCYNIIYPYDFMIKIYPDIIRYFKITGFFNNILSQKDVYCEFLQYSHKHIGVLINILQYILI